MKCSKSPFIVYEKKDGLCNPTPTNIPFGGNPYSIGRSGNP